jgi:hypothetical protein
VTVDDIKKKVANIRIMAYDFEAAHSYEDDLHQEVLRSIADGECEDPKGCATAALSTLDIRFMRSCA